MADPGLGDRCCGQALHGAAWRHELCLPYSHSIHDASPRRRTADWPTLACGNVMNSPTLNDGSPKSTMRRKNSGWGYSHASNAEGRLSVGSSALGSGAGLKEPSPHVTGRNLRKIEYVSQACSYLCLMLFMKDIQLGKTLSSALLDHCACGCGSECFFNFPEDSMHASQLLF